MDIRDINEQLPKIQNGKYLEKIFSLQKELIDHYTTLEGLPNYPIDIHIKKHQVILKDFIGRIIEELAEGFESYLKMLNLKEKREKDEFIIPHLQNFNEELSDALHFFMELLIYCGIDIDYINSYYKNLVNSQNLENFILLGMDNSLDVALKYGVCCNSVMDILNSRQGSHYVIIPDEALKDEFLRGGRLVSYLEVEQYKRKLWDITFSLNIARNTLKNKPWKQTEMMADENNFKALVMQAWVELFTFFSYIGMTDISIFTIYFKKNRINSFRITSKY